MAISGKDAEAKKLVTPNSAVGNQIQDIRQLPGFKELRIAKLYLGKHAVMGVTFTFQTDRIQETVIVIRARRKNDRYFIDDVDLEDPNGLKDEHQRFLKDYGPARFIEYAEADGPESVEK